jgi:AhpD family alkylhydroperoxidase
MPHNHEILDEMRDPVQQLRQAIPGVFRAYADMHHAVIADGALTAKVKELIALAISVTRECDGCIASHARGAVRQKATVDEVAEAMGVTILMNGGPATVYGPRALEAFREFAAATP